jgi:hypothetical protein
LALSRWGEKIAGAIANLNGVRAVALASEFNNGFVTDGKANRVSVFDLTKLKVRPAAVAADGPSPYPLVHNDGWARSIHVSLLSDSTTPDGAHYVQF